MICVEMFGMEDGEALADKLQALGRLDVGTTNRKLAILNAFVPDAQRTIAGLTEADMLLVNADDHHLHRLLAENKAPLITYGLNSKACVTASSVEMGADGIQTVQCCIQRKLFTFTGDTVEQQEFAVSGPENVHTLLAFATAALLCGNPILAIQGR